ncbi:MAG: radical SAM family heme chaperone HemW [Chitinophagales bacterium]
MAGIYIHIPFCKTACNYCNFHFSTSMNMKNDFVQALLKEIELRNIYLGLETIESIYFGGGTPSLLEAEDLKQIFEALYKQYKIASDAEITLEANPDDIDKEKLLVWKQSGINRLSIGTQSFIERDLQFMKRAHTAEEAKKSILLAAESGFDNITIDLIYGVPNQSEMDWLSNLSTAMDLPIQHLSCYALTVEEDTILFHDIRKGKTAAPIDENASTHFDILMAFAAENGIEHYEISNFCKPGFESKHNTSYWQNKAYIGLGPSAHSFNKISRQWNIANNKKYIDALNENKLLFEEETLTKTERLNEYIMTGLRTKWGIDLSYIDEVFDKKKELMNKIGNEDQSLFEWEIKRSKKGTAFIYKLSNKGMHFADRIASNLFFD